MPETKPESTFWFQMQSQSTWWLSSQSRSTMWRNTAQVLRPLPVWFLLLCKLMGCLTLSSFLCTGKVNLEKPLHLVIGSVSPTAVLLSWGNYLKTPYDGNIMNECLEDGWELLLFTILIYQHRLQLSLLLLLLSLNHLHMLRDTLTLFSISFLLSPIKAPTPPLSHKLEKPLESLNQASFATLGVLLKANVSSFLWSVWLLPQIFWSPALKNTTWGNESWDRLFDPPELTTPSAENFPRWGHAGKDSQRETTGAEVLSFVCVICLLFSGTLGPLIARRVSAWH